jgi:hypothetical protein
LIQYNGSTGLYALYVKEGKGKEKEMGSKAEQEDIYAWYFHSSDLTVKLGTEKVGKTREIPRKVDHLSDGK